MNTKHMFINDIKNLESEIEMINYYNMKLSVICIKRSISRR